MLRKNITQGRGQGRSDWENAQRDLLLNESLCAHKRVIKGEKRRWGGPHGEGRHGANDPLVVLRPFGSRELCGVKVRRIVLVEDLTLTHCRIKYE